MTTTVNRTVKNPADRGVLDDIKTRSAVHFLAENCQTRLGAWTILIALVFLGRATPRSFGQTETGTVQINVTLDGKPWMPTSYPSNLVFQLSGPTNRFGFQQFIPEPSDDVIGNYPRNQSVQNVPAGTYKIGFQGMGPEEAIFYDVTPSDTQTLMGGSSISFTFNFRSIQESLVSGPLENWQVRNPLPQGNTLRGVAYGNGTFVATGEDVILNSENGADWAVLPKGANSFSLYRVTFDNGMFVAVGNGYRRLGNLSYEEGAVIAHSRDGRTWSISLFPSAARGVYRYLFGVAHGENGFVAVGGTVSDYGTSVRFGDTFPYVPKGSFGTPAVTKTFVMTSPDGITWETMEPPSSYWLYSVASANNSFLAGGEGGVRLKSTNGKVWTVENPPASGSISAPSLNRLAYFNGQWASVGGILSPFPSASGGSFSASLDGVSWYDRSPQFPNSAPTLLGLAWASGKYVTVGLNGTVLTSTNSPFPPGMTNFPRITMTWTKQLAATEETLWDITFGNGKYVAVGGNGTLLISSNGTDWVMRSSGPTVTLSSIAKAGSKLVAVGGFFPGYQRYRSTIVLSENDGLMWRPVGPTLPLPLSSVIHANGMFVASGSGYVNVTTTNASGAVSSTQVLTNLVLKSPDGKDWIDGSAEVDRWPSKIAQGNGSFVGTRGRNLLNSADGTDWKLSMVVSTNDFDSLTDIAFGNNTFVAAGRGGQVWTSPDGSTWTPQERVSQGDGRLAFGAGLFVMISTGKGLLTSTDGKSWILRGTAFDITGIAYAPLIYGNGMFVVMGVGYQLITSPDGLTWTRHRTDAIGGIGDLIAVGDTFVAVGSGGTILQSGHLSGSLPENVAAINGRVFGADGAVVSGALVQILRNDVVVASSVTDTAGQYRLRDLPPDNYLVRASQGDLSPSAKNVTASQNGSIQLDFTVGFANVTLSDPQSQTVEAGASATFTVTATGSSPLRYQWLFNGVAIPGQTNTTLSLSNVQPAQAGQYSVTVSNPAGSATSREATLTVLLPSETPPRFLAVERVGAGIVLKASTVIGMTYVFEAKTSLNEPQWTLLASFVADRTETELQDANVSSGQKFYRLRGRLSE